MKERKKKEKEKTREKKSEECMEASEVRDIRIKW
jgi:hypothetical protein